jgi:hypothetical protein
MSELRKFLQNRFTYFSAVCLVTSVVLFVVRGYLSGDSKEVAWVIAWFLLGTPTLTVSAAALFFYRTKKKESFLNENNSGG